MRSKGKFSGVDTSAKAFASQRKDFYEGAIATMNLVRAVLGLASMLLVLSIVWMFNVLLHMQYGWVLVILSTLWIIGILVQMGANEEMQDEV